MCLLLVLYYSETCRTTLHVFVCMSYTNLLFFCILRNSIIEIPHDYLLRIPAAFDGE